MALPEMVDRTAWLAARRELLTEEKALTRRRDALNVARRELPMVEITPTTASRAPTGRQALPTCSPDGTS